MEKLWKTRNLPTRKLFQKTRISVLELKGSLFQPSPDFETKPLKKNT